MSRMFPSGIHATSLLLLFAVFSAIPSISQSQDIWPPVQFGPELPDPAPNIPMQYTDQKGEPFDAYNSPSRRWTRFEDFVDAQNEIVAQRRNLLTEITRNKLLIAGLVAEEPSLRQAIDESLKPIRTQVDLLAQATRARNRSLDPSLPPPTGFELQFAEREMEKAQAAIAEHADAVLYATGIFNKKAQSWRSAKFGLFYQFRALARLEGDFQRNLFKNENYHRPAYLSEVTLKSSLGNIYHAVWQPDEKLTEISNVVTVNNRLVSDHETVLASLDKKRQLLISKMLVLEDAWHELNSKSVDVVEAQLWADGFMEVADVVYSTARSGPAATATLLFEGAFRGISASKYILNEWDYKFTDKRPTHKVERKLAYPRLRDDLIEARRAIANSSAGSYDEEGKPQLNKWLTEAGEWASAQGSEGFINSMKEDGLKEVVGTIYDVAKDTRLYGSLMVALDKVRPWAALAIAQSVHQNEGDGLQAVLAIANDVGERLGRSNAVSGMIAQEPINFMDIVNEKVGPNPVKGIVGSFAETAAINMAKSQVHADYDRQRFAIAKRMAETEIEYFIARNNLRSSFEEILRSQLVVQTLMVSYAEEFAQLAKDCCMPRLVRDDTSTVVEALLDDFPENEMLELIVVFSKEVSLSEIGFSIGTVESYRPFTAFNLQADGTHEMRAMVPIDLLDDGREGGKVPFRVRVKQGLPVRKSLDADPASYPFLNNVSIEGQTTGWDSNFETGPDISHAFPRLSQQTGFYLTVADVFGDQGIRVIAAPRLTISVEDEKGDIVYVGETPNAIQPVFVNLAPGHYVLRLDIGSYIPLFEQSCGSEFVRQITVESGKKVNYKAAVKSARVAANGTTMASPKSDCIGIDNRN